MSKRRLQKLERAASTTGLSAAVLAWLGCGPAVEATQPGEAPDWAAIDTSRWSQSARRQWEGR